MNTQVARIDNDLRPVGDNLWGHLSNIVRHGSDYVVPVPVEKEYRPNLRANLTLKYTGELPEDIRDIVRRVEEIERLPADWNSYGGNPLSDAAVIPAFDLIVASHKMCQLPRVILASHGGLDLIWESDDRYLEISVWPDKTYHVAFEDSAAGVSFEPAERVPANVAREQLNRFCSIQ